LSFSKSLANNSINIIKILSQTASQLTGEAQHKQLNIVDATVLFLIAASSKNQNLTEAIQNREMNRAEIAPQ